MVSYRNTEDGRIVERPTEDEWLDASWEWELVPAELAPVTENDNTKGRLTDGR